jgi:hypothetical protein
MRVVVLVIVAAVAGALITLAVTHKSEPEEKAAEEKTEEKRVTIVDGEPTVMIDEETQKKIGLTTAMLETSSRRYQQIEVFGSVVDVQELAAMKNQLDAARVQLQQANARTSADANQLARLRTLNADNKAASDKAVQDAAAAVASDEAAAASAKVAIAAAQSAATQRFGTVIASAMAANYQLYQDLIAFRAVLVQVTIRPGYSVPSSVAIDAGDGTTVNAHFVSPAPRADPHIQGTSEYYVAPAGKLAAGMAVTARFNSLTGVNGIEAPPGAVVSWQGKSWVYVKRDVTHFSRREFNVETIPPGTEVVITGASQLLSEEMKSQLGEE